MGGGVTLLGGSVVISGTAFADGGSPATCRPTPPTTGTTLTYTTNGSRKNWVRVTPTPAGFSTPTCPCAGYTGTVQYRWTLVSAPSGHALYAAATGGSPLADAFSTPVGSVIVAPVYIRFITGINLSPGVNTVRLTVRHICSKGSQRAWSCQAFLGTVNWITGNGRDGDIIGSSSVKIGPPDNSSYCDSPAP